MQKFVYLEKYHSSGKLLSSHYNHGAKSTIAESIWDWIEIGLVASETRLVCDVKIHLLL